MSGYTIGEIVIWLLLAAALGFALGWIARELRLRTKRRATSAQEVRPPVPAEDPDEPATPAKKAPAKKAPAKKAAAKKAPAKKAAAKKVPAKKTPAKKTPAKKATPPQNPDGT